MLDKNIIFVMTVGRCLIGKINISGSKRKGLELMKYEIEYAQFTKIVIEAENESEANDIAAMMDGEDIAEHDPHEYAIWNVTSLT